jgi:hypothetical protein
MLTGGQVQEFTLAEVRVRPNALMESQLDDLSEKKIEEYQGLRPVSDFVH